MQDEPEGGCGFSRKMSLKGVGIGMLGIDHQHGRFGSGEPGADPGVFSGEQGVRFAGQRRAEVYAWVERTLVRHEYAGLGRADKGKIVGQGRTRQNRQVRSRFATIPAMPEQAANSSPNNILDFTLAHLRSLRISGFRT
jgi:hypothetical protein